jgi:hypothetical protein
MTKREGITKSQAKSEADKKPKTLAKKKVERKTLVADDTSLPKAKGGGRRGKPLAQVADNADVVVTDIASADDNAEACADDNAEADADDNAEADAGDDADDNANADDNVEAGADDNADAEADAGDKKEVKKVSDNNTDVSGWNEIKTLRTENRTSKKHSRKNKPEIDNNTNLRASVNPSRKNISNTGLTFIQNSHGRFEQGSNQSSNQSFNQNSNQSPNTGYASRLNYDNSLIQQSSSRGVQFERHPERRPERRQGGVLSFDRVDALTSGNKKMSECDDETILKYMIAVTEKRSQKMLADLYKNILTGIKLETPLPTVPSETTVHTTSRDRERDIHFLTESRPWRRDRSDRDNRGYYNRSSTRG